MFGFFLKYKNAFMACFAHRRFCLFVELKNPKKLWMSNTNLCLNINSDAARSTVINWPEEGDGARGQKATSAEKSEKAKRESNHGPEDFDAGEVVNRRRRNDLPIVAPAFSSIQVEINDKKQERFQNVAQNDFEGFSIERED